MRYFLENSTADAFTWVPYFDITSSSSKQRLSKNLTSWLKSEAGATHQWQPHPGQLWRWSGTRSTHQINARLVPQRECERKRGRHWHSGFSRCSLRGGGANRCDCRLPPWRLPGSPSEWHGPGEVAKGDGVAWRDGCSCGILSSCPVSLPPKSARRRHAQPSRKFWHK